MAKEAYYFSHDSNAKSDPKILQMRAVYGALGYGWFWILVEMMREEENYKLDMRPKYAFDAFASQMQCEKEKAHQYIQDCIHEFHLFQSDNSYFWSESLLRRMSRKQEKSEKASQSANARWSKKPAPDQGLETFESNSQCVDDANAPKNDAIKESKVNENKEKESKENTSTTNGVGRIGGDNPFTLFVTHGFGKLDHITRDFIGCTIDDYTEDWVIKAIKEAVMQNKIVWKYVERILQRWKASGHQDPWTLEKPEEKPRQSNQSFGKGQKNKPQMIQDTEPSERPSEEQLAEMRERAVALDKKLNNPPARSGVG